MQCAYPHTCYSKIGEEQRGCSLARCVPEGGSTLMAEKPVNKLNDLYRQFRDGQIDRRQFIGRATALGFSAAALTTFLRAVPAGAQDATPAASGGVITS